MSDIEGRSRDFGILGQPKVEPKAPKQSGRNRSAEPSNKSNDPKAATHPASRHQPKTRQPMNPFDDSYETFPPFSHSDTSRKSVESGKRGRSPAAAAHPPFAVSQNSLTESGNPFKGPFDDSRDASPSPSSDPSTSTKSNEPGTRGRARGGRKLQLLCLLEVHKFTKGIRKSLHRSLRYFRTSGCISIVS